MAIVNYELCILAPFLYVSVTASQMPSDIGS